MRDEANDYELIEDFSAAARKRLVEARGDELRALLDLAFSNLPDVSLAAFGFRGDDPIADAVSWAVDRFRVRGPRHGPRPCAFAQLPHLHRGSLLARAEGRPQGLRSPHCGARGALCSLIQTACEQRPRNTPPPAPSATSSPVRCRAFAIGHALTWWASGSQGRSGCGETGSAGVAKDDVPTAAEHLSKRQRKRLRARRHVPLPLLLPPPPDRHASGASRAGVSAHQPLRLPERASVSRRGARARPPGLGARRRARCRADSGGRARDTCFTVASTSRARRAPLRCATASQPCSPGGRLA